MKINYYILNASGKMTCYKNEIKNTINKALNQIKKEISLHNIDILIRESENPKQLKDLNGVGAYCPSANFVQISLDITHPFFCKFPSDAIKKPLIHELHHAVRRNYGINIDKSTFLECVWSEGLADYFVYLLTGDLSKWIIKLNSSTKLYLLRRLNKEKNKEMTLVDYEKWFIAGSKKEKIPKWAGYSLSFELVKVFLERNKNITIGQLTKLPAGRYINTAIDLINKQNKRESENDNCKEH